MRNTVCRFIGAAALIGSAGCLPSYEPGNAGSDKLPAEGAGVGTSTQVSNLPAPVRPLTAAEQSVAWLTATDVAVLAARAAEEGPPEVASRRHSCQKVRYQTIGTVLQTLGVDMGTLPVDITTNCALLVPAGKSPTKDFMPAKYVYCDSRLTLGLPQYGARLAENTTATTAGATKLLDLFVTAAPEIIANAGNMPQCKINGTASPVFIGDSCNAAGISCIQGYPATDDQVALCNRVVTQAVATPASGTVPALSGPDNGKRIAVAAILSAIHSCE